MENDLYQQLIGCVAKWLTVWECCFLIMLVLCCIDVTDLEWNNGVQIAVGDSQVSSSFGFLNAVLNITPPMVFVCRIK